MTQEELCERLGITQAALSRYENDLREPDAETLARIGEALGLSTAFLTHDFRLRGALAADAHMRRQKTTKASDWKRAEARLNMLRAHTSYVLERVPLRPDNHLPTFDPIDTTPEDAARLVRAQWKMPVGPVRNLTRWVESAGVIIVDEDLGTRRMDGLSQWAADHPVVLLNSALPPDRARLTLAHELGHLVLHAAHVDVDMESQASAFAAEFLMPEHVIKPALRSLSLGRLLDLKSEWGVSMQALVERAYRLGRLSPDERTQFYKAMNARGWKTREPGSERIPVEQPELAASIGSALRSKGLSPRDVASVFGFGGELKEDWLLPRTRHLRAL